VILYWSPRSPYVRMVSVTAHALGLGDRIETRYTLVNIEEPHPELMQHTPLGKIPALVLPDGTTLVDSRVICEHLDALGGGRLLPADSRLEQLRRQALAIGLIDLLIALLIERNRPAGAQSAGFIAAQKTKFDAVIDTFERLAQALRDEPFAMGHIAIGTALAYADFRFPDLEWHGRAPELARWHAGFVTLPCYLADPFFNELAARRAAEETR
jgi:glutathione S-transferase